MSGLNDIEVKIEQAAIFTLPKKVELSDAERAATGYVEETLRVAVRVTDAGYLEISIPGYGECAVNDGHGSPVLLEHYEGELSVIVFDDINNEEPQKLPLEGAREDRRKPDHP